MSLIVCTDPCVYQAEGYCSLSRAVSAGCPSIEQSCLHFLPRHSAGLENRGERLANVLHRNDP